jgi:hypothetical protein
MGQLSEIVKSPSTIRKNNQVRHTDPTIHTPDALDIWLSVFGTT